MRLFVALALLLGAALPVLAQPVSDWPDLRIGGIEKWADAETALETLGPADSVWTRPNEFTGGTVHMHAYGRDELSVEAGAVIGFRLRSAARAVEGLGPDGWRVGDASDGLQRLSGARRVVDPGSLQLRHVWFVTGDGESLWFGIEEDRIVEIMTATDY